jgi:hypothetical protein
MAWKLARFGILFLQWPSCQPLLFGICQRAALCQKCSPTIIAHLRDFPAQSYLRCAARLPLRATFSLHSEAFSIVFIVQRARLARFGENGPCYVGHHQRHPALRPHLPMDAEIDIAS